MTSTDTALLKRITTNPVQCGVRPCIWGKRLRANGIPDLLSADASQEETLQGYPLLKREDIAADLRNNS